MPAFGDLVDAFPGISLEALDERAALLRRVDNKYALRWPELEELAARLRGDHEVLEIDGHRDFGYLTTYFDTPEIRCFVDHVDGRVPRFKVRSRAYEDSGDCSFEVKIKRSGDQTDKRQLDYAIEDRSRVTAAGWQCIRDALSSVGLDPPTQLRPTLETAFRRLTLAATGGSERLTCDAAITLRGPDGSVATIEEGAVLVETKSAEGRSPADRALNAMGVRPISLSKYRVGMSLAGGGRAAGPQPGHELFR